MAVWIGDGLSDLGLSLYGRALSWRIKRLACPRSTLWAIVDLCVLAVVGGLIWRAV